MRLCKAFESGNIGTIVNISTSKKKKKTNSKKPNLKFCPTSLIIIPILRLAFQTKIFLSMNGSEIHWQLVGEKINYLRAESLTEAAIHPLKLSLKLCLFLLFGNEHVSLPQLATDV